MPYTIGTSHGPFTGTGSFVIAKPAGIRTIVTNIPSWTGHENTSPLRYHRLGRFTLGNSHGFSESQLLEYAQQLVYPIPAIWELLAYDINDGASCTFYELVAVPDLTALQPWDRTPSPMNASATAIPTGGAAAATMFTYTVPTGRRLMLAQASAWIGRVTAPTTANYNYVQITVDGTVLVYVDLRAGMTAGRVEESLHAGPLILNAGSVIAATYQNADTGGSSINHATCRGTLFDA